MSYDTQRPHVASYVLAKRDGKIAFVFRKNTSWMNNFYGLASGKVETGESFTEAAIREAEEEIGIKVRSENLTPVLTMHRFDIGNHAPEWVDVFFEATEWEGEPVNNEPDIHGEVAWFDPKDLPENVIPSVKAAIEAIESGKNYIEYGLETR